jgi:hypothetical protein
MYVWSIDFHTIGWGWRLMWLYVDITIRHDSNANGKADATDEPVNNASVNMLLVNQTTGQQFIGNGMKTSNNGIATYYVYNPAKGTYTAQATNLTHAIYTWNQALDEENPSDPYTITVNVNQPENALDPMKK